MDSIKNSDQSEEQLSADPIRLAGATLGKYRHVCAFFHSADEEYRVLLPFIKDGFARGEKAFHVVNPRLCDEHLQRLASAGVAVTEAEQGGQLELRNWEEAYFREGGFDQNKMLALFPAALEEARQRGFPLTRLICHMEWALEDRSGVNDLLEYETRYNLLPRYPDPVICVYDLAKFGGDVVIDVMRTHPMIIIGGILQENPFFIPPDEFLQELRDREAGRKVAHT